MKNAAVILRWSFHSFFQDFLFVRIGYDDTDGSCPCGSVVGSYDMSVYCLIQPGPLCQHFIISNVCFSNSPKSIKLSNGISNIKRS
jgi:hypothetical protein